MRNLKNAHMLYIIVRLRTCFAHSQSSRDWYANSKFLDCNLKIPRLHYLHVISRLHKFQDCLQHTCNYTCTCTHVHVHVHVLEYAHKWVSLLPPSSLCRLFGEGSLSSQPEPQEHSAGFLAAFTAPISLHGWPHLPVLWCRPLQHCPDTGVLRHIVLYNYVD